MIRRCFSSSPPGGVARTRPGTGPRRTRTRTGRRSPADRRRSSWDPAVAISMMYGYRAAIGVNMAAWTRDRRRWRRGKHLLGEPPHPAAEGVHHVVGEVDGEAAGPEHADERVHVVQHDRRGAGARLDHLRRPRVAQQRLSGREDPLPDRVPSSRRSRRAGRSRRRSGRPCRRVAPPCWPRACTAPSGTTPSSWARLRMLRASIPTSSASATAARSTRSRFSGRAPGLPFMPRFC